jgi:magnesium-protoporphyrin IX monomethyl ester (oxidative) cyclase
MYLSAYTKKYYTSEPLEISIYDGYFKDDGWIINECAHSDVVGLSGTTPQLSCMLELASQIKAKNDAAKIVLGGFGPSLEPEKCLNNPFVNHVVIGEGERAFLDILNGAGDKIVNRTPIENIDSIPFPDREAVDLEKYIALAEREEGRRVTSILASRGCPFGCTFCAEGEFGSIWGETLLTDQRVMWKSKKKLRIRSSQNVLEEMNYVQKRYNIGFLKFSDAELNYSKRFIIDLCKEMVHQKWDIPWGANFRADTIDEEICMWLAKANCTETWFGVESGSPVVLGHIKKGISVEMIKNAFTLTKKYGILRRAYFILGTPPESLDTIKQTETLIDEINPDVVSFSILAPYPGTSYWRSEFKNIDWSKVDEYSNNIWSSAYLTNAQLKSEQTRLMDKYEHKLAPIVRKKRALGVIS